MKEYQCYLICFPPSDKIVSEFLSKEGGKIVEKDYFGYIRFEFSPPIGIQKKISKLFGDEVYFGLVIQEPKRLIAYSFPPEATSSLDELEQKSKTHLDTILCTLSESLSSLWRDKN